MFSENNHVFSTIILLLYSIIVHISVLSFIPHENCWTVQNFSHVYSLRVVILNRFVLNLFVPRCKFLTTNASLRTSRSAQKPHLFILILAPYVYFNSNLHKHKLLPECFRWDLTLPLEHLTTGYNWKRHSCPLQNSHASLSIPSISLVLTLESGATTVNWRENQSHQNWLLEPYHAE